MGAIPGKLYHVKHGRSLWAYGPDNPTEEDDFALENIPDDEVVLYVEEVRSPSGDLQWVKVIHGEYVGYLRCQFLSVGSLLRQAQDPELRSSLPPEGEGRSTAVP